MTKTEIDFAKKEMELAKYLQSLSPEEEIKELCSMAGCKEKIRKVHQEQFIRRKWNPHPSERFIRWWINRGMEAVEEVTNRGWARVDAIQAYNCEPVRDCYRAFLKEQRIEMQEYEPTTQVTD